MGIIKIPIMTSHIYRKGNIAWLVGQHVRFFKKLNIIFGASGYLVGQGIKSSPPRWKRIAFLKRFLLRNPQAIFLICWILAFLASSILLFTLCIIAFIIPQKYLLIVFLTAIIGLRRELLIQPRRRIHCFLAADKYLKSHNIDAASLILHALAVLRFI